MNNLTNNNNRNSNGHTGIGNTNSGISNLTAPRLAAIVLRRVPDNQGFELWVLYPNPTGAASIPPKRSMLMAFSRDVSLTLARQIARLVATDYGLSGFIEEA